MSDRTFARWWRESLLGPSRLRRHLLPGIGLLGGAMILPGCYEFGLVDHSELAQDEEEQELSVAALKLQREQGWNVGQPNAPLVFPQSTGRDVDGSDGWKAAMPKLAQTLAPTQPALMPYYVPTLFAALADPSSAALREIMSPIATPEMARAYARGQALLSLFNQAGWPADTAIVVDVPGPEATALAAALADRFEPIFTFDNWPHPLGVVPSHQTLAATLYYLPFFERARAARPTPAPPVLVLDANRLRPYTDEDSQFDNRYRVKIPGAEGLARLGIHHVLYVTAGTEQSVELDDLNEEFVALGEAGVDVKMVALSDFIESTEEPPIEPGEEDEPIWGPRFEFEYVYYGGSPYDHLCFWEHYGWYHNRRAHHAVVVGPPHMTRSYVSPALHYAPMRRATMFTAAPPTFGHVAIRASRASGLMTGVRAGRSGSFGMGIIGGHIASARSSGFGGRSGSFGRFHGGGVGS